jgi:hypothetical protein
MLWLNYFLFSEYIIFFFFRLTKWLFRLKYSEFKMYRNHHFLFLKFCSILTKHAYSTCWWTLGIIWQRHILNPPLLLISFLDWDVQVAWTNHSFIWRNKEREVHIQYFTFSRDLHAISYFSGPGRLGPGAFI